MPDKWCKRTAGKAVYDQGMYKIQWTNEKGETWLTEFGVTNRELAERIIMGVMEEQGGKAK